jgi:hypothetical protein
MESAARPLLPSLRESGLLSVEARTDLQPEQDGGGGRLKPACAGMSGQYGRCGETERLLMIGI